MDKSFFALTGKTAKHLDLQQQIVEAIKAGRLKLGDKLPGEEILARELNVSKAVVRNAYLDLIKLGWIRRLPKKGLIVFPAFTSHTFSTQLQSVGYDIRSAGLTPKVKFLNQETMVNSSLSAFHPGERLLKVKRLFFAEDVPIFVMESYYSLDRFSKLESLDLKTIEFFNYFKHEYGVNVTRIKRSFKAILMPKEIAELLETSADTGCFKVNAYAYDKDNLCVEYSLTYSIGDQFSIELN